jgi:heme exporter protein A
MNLPIEARRLEKYYAHTPVLRGIDLKVERGSGVVIIGRNGSGKSTMVRVLAGLAAASSGEALLFGRPSGTLDPHYRRRLGVVTHQSFLYPAMTAYENLEFFAALYGLRINRQEMTGLLHRIGLGHAVDERVHTFSRGMEQRLTIVRALIADPEVLLMDEPMTALDSEGVAVAIGLIDDVVSRGCSVLITAHEPPNLGRNNFLCYELIRGRLGEYGQDTRSTAPTKRSAAAG